MTEQERLIVIERIKRNLEKQKESEEKKKRREELKQNDAVKEYLKLSNEIGKLNKELTFLKNEEQMTELEFIWAFQSRIKAEGFLPCNHDIWLYYGSYCLWEDPRCEHDHEYRLFDETDEDFSYNKYKCLECGKLIQVEDWEDFEEENLVLKNKHDSDIEKYINLYYQTLYNHTVEESKQIVIKEFNKNKTKTIGKIRKRSPEELK